MKVALIYGPYIVYAPKPAYQAEFPLNTVSQVVASGRPIRTL